MQEQRASRTGYREPPVLLGIDGQLSHLSRAIHTKAVAIHKLVGRWPSRAIAIASRGGSAFPVRTAATPVSTCDGELSGATPQ
jgi:hypothetical protein